MEKLEKLDKIHHSHLKYKKNLQGCRNLEDSLLAPLAAKSDGEEEEGRGKLHSDISIPSES